MKKLTLIALALAIAAVLVLSSCASTGGGGSGEPQVRAERTEWFLSRTDGGVRARDNQVNMLPGKNELYIYFPKRQVEFTGIKIDFTMEKELEVLWLAVQQDDAVLGSEELIGVMDKGPIETDFASFTKQWYVGNWGKNTVDTASIRCVVLQVNNPSGRALFTLTNVEFLGMPEQEE